MVKWQTSILLIESKTLMEEEGLEFDDAYDKASEEFQALFAEQSDQEQGIASII